MVLVCFLSGAGNANACRGSEYCPTDGDEYASWCSSPSDPSSPSGGQAGAYSILDDLRERLTRAFAEGSEDDIADRFADVSELSLPGRAVVEGRENIRDSLRAFFRENEVKLSLEPAPGTSRIRARLAEERGTFRLRIVPAAGEARRISGPYRLEARLGDGLRLTRLSLSLHLEEPKR